MSEELDALRAQFRIDAQKAHGIVGDYAAAYPTGSPQRAMAKAVGDALAQHFEGGIDTLDELRRLRDEVRALRATDSAASAT